MRHYIILLGVALIIAAGCSSDKRVTYQPIEEPDPYLTAVAVDSIGQSWYAGHYAELRYVEVTVFTTVTSPCWEYSHIETSNIGPNYYVKVFVARDSSDSCPADTTVIPVRILITLSSETFEMPDSVFFWQDESTYLEVEYTGGGIV
ncbi:MAG: hypothetical protein AB1483_08495 [Candidatus Zixiibacteriota bacterium]